MGTFDHSKYQPFPPIQMLGRSWPDRVINQAPRWCAVDLRDGNQALVSPMTSAQKQRLFDLLVDVGFKEIEIGFPAASGPDYDFTRRLIDDGRIPDDVSVQVLTQAREELIERTFAALAGVKQAVVHLYNSTSRVQREQVFRMDRQGIIDIAVRGAAMVRDCAARYPETEWTFQYSPESFTGTELDFAVEICEAVMAAWQPTPERPMIVNLPATVEMATPNVFADQVEWFATHIRNRKALILSVHTHNDRGSAVAAAELALMAGADRVEGTLMGNGERTGNTDLVTMAMNLYSQGIDPHLDLSDADRIVETVEACTRIQVHPRHPYVGELVYTAFSGSHQDAIRKCLNVREQGAPWEVAYLPIDPQDLGRSYEAIIRINSQSGKGGVAYVLESTQGLQLPRWLQVEFSRTVQARTESSSSELTSAEVWHLFQEAYMAPTGPYRMTGYHIDRDATERVDMGLEGPEGMASISGRGDGTLEALLDGLQRHTGMQFDVEEYNEHAITSGTDAEAACYLRLRRGDAVETGVAIHRDSVGAVINAVVNAVNCHVQVKQREAA